MKTIHWRASLGVVALGALIALILLVTMPRAEAARAQVALQAMTVGQTHFQGVEQLAQEFGGNALCVGDNCVFQFRNRWLHWLHLAPLTQFSVKVHRQGSAWDPGGGSVGAMDWAMLVNRDPLGSGIVASALVFERTGAAADPFRVNAVMGTGGRPRRTTVMLAPNASPTQRAQAVAFNLRCLTRIGGCRASSELLPDAPARQVQASASSSSK